MNPAQVETLSKPTHVNDLMKTAWWTAILVFALMVGGISFISVYVGDTTAPKNQDAQETITSSALSFPFKTFPREGEKLHTTEIRQVGLQDFWFVNESDQDVNVGLSAKGCTCTEVELTVAPPNWMPYLARSAVIQAMQQPLRGLDNLTILAALNDRDQQFPELPEAQGTMLTRELYARVPAGAVGRVRLNWHQEQLKSMLIYAELWIGQQAGNVVVRLETGVRIAAPLEVNKEREIDPITERELERMEREKVDKGRQGRGWILCYSLTRPKLQLKAEILHDRPQGAQSDPVEVGEPIPLEPEYVRKLESQKELHLLSVSSAYRIPVTVRPRAKDGTPMEWGRFQRVVQLSSPDSSFDPVHVQVTGEVVGDISIGVGDELGTINLGPFPRKHGAKRAINLETDEKKIELELDQTRKPKFLNVSLSAPQNSAGHRSWVLRVEVPPNGARGEFPRKDNPDYRDSAIYVKTKGGKAGASLRSIRIPVRGVANEG